MSTVIIVIIVSKTVREGRKEAGKEEEREDGSKEVREGGGEFKVGLFLPKRKGMMVPLFMGREGAGG